jgi:hypothetical protein
MFLLIKAIRVIAVILGINLLNLFRWSGLTHRMDMAFSRWFLFHQPTNWSAWAQKWKAPLAKIRDLAKKL